MVRLFLIFEPMSPVPMFCLSASIFDPDRWIDERMKLVTRNPFIFLPFNAGPRICLGQQVCACAVFLHFCQQFVLPQFAYSEMSYFLIRLLQNFSEISFAEDVQPPETRPPAEWKSCPGTKGTDKIRFTVSLTLAIKVSSLMS
jgi:hypothetical protein